MCLKTALHNNLSTTHGRVTHRDISQKKAQGSSWVLLLSSYNEFNLCIHLLRGSEKIKLISKISF